MGGTGHARELRFNQTIHVACTAATQPKMPTQTHTYSLRRRARRPTSSYAKSTHKHMGERGTRVTYASTETLHGVDSNTTQNTNPDPHTYSLQRRTRRPTSLYANSAHASVVFLVGGIPISGMFIRMTKRRYTIQSQVVSHGIKLLTGCVRRVTGSASS